MAQNLRLLLIDSSFDDVQVVVSELTRSGYDVVAARVDSPGALAEALDREEWDLAIADYTFGGPAALEVLRQHDPDLPFIFVSDTDAADAAVSAIKTGAHDYIKKGDLSRLSQAVERELREAGARRERRRIEQRLAYLAYHDALTELPNRTLLHDRLEQALRVGGRDGMAVALLLLDLNDFKEINDTLGHHAGDRVLQSVSKRVRAMLRQADTVARLGGDEFAVVLPMADVDGALLTAEKLLRAVEEPCIVDHRPLSVRASIGIACYPEHGHSAEMLLERADTAMYAAKTDRVGVAVYAPNRDVQTHRRLSFIAELRNGLDEGQFFVEYQPIVDLRMNIVSGVEALVRWNHPTQGRVLPGDFIHLAEQTGLINPLTTIVLETSIREWTPLQNAPPIAVAVNVSSRTLQDPRLPQRIAAMLDGYDAPPFCLALEITENILMADPARSLDRLHSLHEMGVRIVIDDFGTGYSSLSYLRRLPVNELKIDGSFVAGLASGHDDVIVRSTIDLAHNLGLGVIAEGVEDAEVLDRLRELGCDAVQGRLFSEPKLAPEMRDWIAQQNPIASLLLP